MIGKSLNWKTGNPLPGLAISFLSGNWGKVGTYTQNKNFEFLNNHFENKHKLNYCEPSV